MYSIGQEEEQLLTTDVNYTHQVGRYKMGAYLIPFMSETLQIETSAWAKTGLAFI